MKYLIPFFFLLLCGNTAPAQNGKIVAREKVNILQNEKIALRISYKKNGKRYFHEKYQYLDDVQIERITYLSDGLKVKGYLAYPKANKKQVHKKQYPCVIYNRGGNRSFGALSDFKAAFILAKVASWGYIVAGSQYRGNMGGEGKEEFGGSDVNDILNLVPLFNSFPQADTSRIALYGWSRGGMMTYLTLSRSCQFKVAIVGAGLSDLWTWMHTRPDTIETVFAQNIPHYATNTKAALDQRSAIRLVDNICKSTPILILHGTADWRVAPEMALDLSKAFIKENITHRLVLFEGGDHSLRDFTEEVDEQVKRWLAKMEN
ncbi:MAG TPA: hypothetical protein ENJ45_02015 [Phaeodactylibacter sp.]|nr:hypothetical protein [Phaeodactylibacter sp.]